jgi:3'(2'), 5'-bisphosphate nucleotidase
VENLDRELELARAVAREAGRVILRHYRDPDVRVETKPDQSPVTAADEEANATIVSRLSAAFPDDAILSEESPDDPVRFQRRRVWIVDPLDGTRDFLANTDDFCVLIGLAIEERPVLGVVYHPVKDELYFARKGSGAFLETQAKNAQLATSRRQDPGELRAGISRLNPDEGLGKLLAASGLAPRAVSLGASVKHMALARGDIDAVLNLSPAEQEWDTCAPEVIITEAGGTVTDGDGRPFRYNQKDTARRRGSVASNGVCHPFMLRIIAPALPAPTTTALSK